MLKQSDTVKSIELSGDIMMMVTPSRSTTPTKIVKGKKPARLNLKENKITSKPRAQKKKPEWSAFEPETVRILSPRQQQKPKKKRIDAHMYSSSQMRAAEAFGNSTVQGTPLGQLEQYNARINPTALENS